MRTRRVLPWLLALALVLGACGGDGDDGGAEEQPTTAGGPTEPQPPATEPEEALPQSCSNAELGFSIRYPEGWHTNGGEVLPSCTFFHPEPFEVPEATEVTDVAVMTRREPVPLDRIAGGDPGTEVVESEEAEVAGRPAVRRETEATGEGLFPAGQRATQYLVDLDGETLVLETYDVEALDYERNRRVLDEMARSLELGEGLEPVGAGRTEPLELDPSPDLGPEAFLADVRVGRHEGFDRVVFEFEGDDRPGVRIAPAEPPVLEQPSGRELGVAGETFLEVTLQPATRVDLSGEEPRRTYSGPDRIELGGAAVQEVVLAGDHESLLRWVVGLRGESSYAATFFEDPLRLVVDVLAAP